MGTRSHSAVAGFPRKDNRSRAALTFAGNIATSNTIKHVPATLRTFGSSNPTAPRKVRGTMRSKSRFMLVKCALPVTTNITAKA